MEPSEHAWQTPLKGGNMILNRFCIDEDAAFELSGVNCLKESSQDIIFGQSRKSEPVHTVVCQVEYFRIKIQGRH